MGKLNIKAEIKFSFIVLILVLIIVLAFIIINSGVFAKTQKFVSSCKSTQLFEYKCANTIDKGKPTQLTCPGGWSVDMSKDCEKIDKKEVECCYRDSSK